MLKTAESEAVERTTTSRALGDRWLALRAGLEYSEWQALPSELRAAVKRHGVGAFHRLHEAAGGVHFSLWLPKLNPLSDWLMEFGVAPFLTIAHAASSKGISSFDFDYVLKHCFSAVRMKIDDCKSLEAYGTAWIDALSGNDRLAFRLADVSSSLPLILGWITSPESLRDLLRQIFEVHYQGDAACMGGVDFCVLLPLFADQVNDQQSFTEYLSVFADVKPSYYVIRSLAMTGAHIHSAQEFREFLTIGQELMAMGADSRDRRSKGLIEFLPLNSSIVKKHGLKPFLDIAAATGPSASETFKVGLPAISALVDEYGIAPFVEMASREGSSTALLFGEGLASVQTLIKRLGLNAFVGLCKDASPHAGALCLAFAESPDLITNETDLHDLSVWRRTLYEVRAKLKRPWLEEYEQTGPYGESWGTGYTRHDPEQLKREAIDDALNELRRRLLPPLGTGSHRPEGTLDVLRELPPPISEFLGMLVDNGLNDVVVIGGVPRDLLLGRDFKDVDFTFSLNLLPEDKALENDPYLWNSVLAGAVRRQLKAVFRLMDSGHRWNEVPDHQCYVDRVKGLLLHYVGPFESYGDGHYARSRWSAVFSNGDGRLLSLDPGVSLNSLGLTTDRRLIGDPCGLEDLRNRQIRTLKPIGDLAPDTVLRYLLLSDKLQCQLSIEIENAIRHFGELAHAHSAEFASRAQKTTALNQLLSEITYPAKDSVVDSMIRLGVADAFASLPDYGGSGLRRLLDSRRPPVTVPRHSRFILILILVLLFAAGLAWFTLLK